jgi:hypothetical protein
MDGTNLNLSLPSGSNRRMTGLLYCQDPKELLDAFAETIREPLKLHEEQFQAVISGDPDSTLFDDPIHVSNQRKHEAK